MKQEVEPIEIERIVLPRQATEPLLAVLKARLRQLVQARLNLREKGQMSFVHLGQEELVKWLAVLYAVVVFVEHFFMGVREPLN